MFYIFTQKSLNKWMDTSFKKVSSFFIEKNEKTAYWVREDFANDMTNKGLISQSIQLLSHVQLFATPGTAVCQAALFTNSWSLLKLMSIELVMPSNHLILCRPLLLLPSIFPNIRVFQWYSIYIYKQLIQPNIKRKKHKKWAEELNRHFSRRKYRWPTDTWKDAQHC